MRGGRGKRGRLGRVGGEVDGRGERCGGADVSACMGTVEDWECLWVWVARVWRLIVLGRLFRDVDGLGRCNFGKAG